MDFLFRRGTIPEPFWHTKYDMARWGLCDYKNPLLYLKEQDGQLQQMQMKLPYGTSPGRVVLLPVPR